VVNETHIESAMNTDFLQAPSMALRINAHLYSVKTRSINGLCSETKHQLYAKNDRLLEHKRQLHVAVLVD
jgi:hypothetical protein